MEIQEKMYWMALQAGINEHVFHIAKQIVAQYGSVASFWRARDSARLSGVSDTVREKLILARKRIYPEKLWDMCRQKKIEAVCCIEEGYPKELLHFPDCPVILYYYGRVSLMNRPSAAIVGSRRSTAYGRKIAADFAKAFAEAGLCVVSGMAKGIDAAAHEGALSVHGDTVAVLGSGVDVPYPPENRRLYQQIKDEGLVVSEFIPGDKPAEWHFPLRNRIISGLSRFVLLAEGEARSGALITCGWAAEQGKDVWAAPGPVTNPFSIGPLLLIRDGAMMAITPADILTAYGWGTGDPTAEDLHKYSNGQRRREAAAPPGNVRLRDISKQGRREQQALFQAENKTGAVLSPGEKKLLASISYYPVHIDGLIALHNEARREKAEGSLYMDLTKLLSLRLIEKLAGDYYQRI